MVCISGATQVGQLAEAGVSQGPGQGMLQQPSRPAKALGLNLSQHHLHGGEYKKGTHLCFHF